MAYRNAPYQIPRWKYPYDIDPNVPPPAFTNNQPVMSPPQPMGVPDTQAGVPIPQRDEGQMLYNQQLNSWRVNQAQQYETDTLRGAGMQSLDIAVEEAKAWNEEKRQAQLRTEKLEVHNKYEQAELKAQELAEKWKEKGISRKKRIEDEAQGLISQSREQGANPPDVLKMDNQAIQDYIIQGGTLDELEQRRYQEALQQMRDRPRFVSRSSGRAQNIRDIDKMGPKRRERFLRNRATAQAIMDRRARLEERRAARQATREEKERMLTPPSPREIFEMERMLGEGALTTKRDVAGMGAMGRIEAARIAAGKPPKPPNLRTVRGGEYIFNPVTGELEPTNIPTEKPAGGYDLIKLRDWIYKATHTEGTKEKASEFVKMGEGDLIALQEIARKSGYQLRVKTTQEKSEPWFGTNKDWEGEYILEPLTGGTEPPTGGAEPPMPFEQTVKFQTAPDPQLDPYWNKLTPKQKEDIWRRLDQNPNAIAEIMEMIRSATS